MTKIKSVTKLLTTKSGRRHNSGHIYATTINEKLLDNVVDSIFCDADIICMTCGKPWVGEQKCNHEGRILTGRKGAVARFTASAPTWLLERVTGRKTRVSAQRAICRRYGIDFDTVRKITKAKPMLFVRFK